MPDVLALAQDAARAFPWAFPFLPVLICAGLAWIGGRFI